MDFVNRISELAALNRLYKTTGFQFVPVYGRRRIGKTRLIQEFIKDKKAVYFLADSVSETEQLKNLGQALGEHFTDNILQDRGFKDWYQMFSYLKEKGAGRFALIIDEFPHLVNANRAISSIFQKGIDQYLKETNLFLVLMGSSVGMMEKEVLFHKAPLYGRRTASMEIGEMAFAALARFFPTNTFDVLSRIYAVFGTVPAYLEKVNPRKDIFANIEELVLDRNTFFYNEVEFILREELREPRNYFVILRAIAQGKRKLGEIINDTGFEKSLVAKYIDTLRTLRFVEKEIPVTEKYPEKSKQGLYRLHDRFFAFWFKYIFPNRGRIEINNIDYVAKLIRDSFEHHVSMAYEDICKGLCQALVAEGLIRFSVIGKWWSKNEEIDIVALDEESKTAYFAECKWSSKKVREDIYRELIRKSSLVDWSGDKRTNRYILFSKSGFTESMIEIARKEKIILIHQDKVVGAENLRLLYEK
jgi:AAA+ ATPase superfamily predicted ATPase